MDPADLTTWLANAGAIAMFVAIVRLRKATWKVRFATVLCAALLTGLNWMIGSNWVIAASELTRRTKEAILRTGDSSLMAGISKCVIGGTVTIGIPPQPGAQLGRAAARRLAVRTQASSVGFTLVPWGRFYEEYVSMFDLAETDLKLLILSCGDGPAGFNSALTKRGGTITSVDPIYAFDAAQIRARISESYETVMAQMRQNQNDYVWDAISLLEDLGRVRMSAMDTFLSDYESGRKRWAI